MRAAIDNEKISLEQYGRPQLSAVACGINHILVFEYQESLQQFFSLTCSDMKSCYDRILHSTTILALQHLVIPFLAILIILEIIQIMTNTIRTAYSDSNLTYRGDTITDEFRQFNMVIFQVNSSSPQIWPIISSIVLSSILYQGCGIHLSQYFAT